MQIVDQNLLGRLYNHYENFIITLYCYLRCLYETSFAIVVIYRGAGYSV